MRSKLISMLQNFWYFSSILAIFKTFNICIVFDIFMCVSFIWILVLFPVSSFEMKFVKQTIKSKQIRIPHFIRHEKNETCFKPSSESWKLRESATWNVRFRWCGVWFRNVYLLIALSTVLQMETRSKGDLRVKKREKVRLKLNNTKIKSNVSSHGTKIFHIFIYIYVYEIFSCLFSPMKWNDKEAMWNETFY